MRLPRSNPTLVPARAFADGDITEPVVIRTRPGVQTVVAVSLDSDDLEDKAWVLPLPPDRWDNVAGKLDLIIANGQPLWTRGFYRFEFTYDPEAPVWKVFFGTDAAPSGTAKLSFQVWEEPLPPFLKGGAP